MDCQKINYSFIIFWYMLTCCSVILFLYGFFPVKNKNVNSIIDPPSYVQDIKVNAIELYQALVDRIIIVVIDALRIDFINEKSTPYLLSIIKKGNGCVLTTKVESPTVTMPRIKAITTGSVPQFIDIVLNFASTEIKEDSFLHRIRDLRKNIAFYGDETWLKLFPNMFIRSEGTSSFYVTDYTEVDNNVTRNLPLELHQKDWNVLILHYLGLDHIGHVYGPFSPLIHEKLFEMDQIILNIHGEMNKQKEKSVILIMGDHGMRDTGGHGGSTGPETLVPLVVLNLHCSNISSYSEVQIMQTDIAPTISALLGVPLPSDSVGRILPQLLESATKNISNLLYIYYYNALNLISQDSTKHILFQECFQEHKKYLIHLSDGVSALKLYRKKLLEVSENLVKTSSKQIISYLYISCSILICCLFSLILPSHAHIHKKLVLLIVLSFGTEYLLFDNTSITSTISILLAIISLFFSFTELRNNIQVFTNHSLLEALLFWGSLIGTFCLASTSFIEEEHQTWYFLWGTLALLFAQQYAVDSYKYSAMWIVIFIGLRVLRTFNQVGDRWLAVPDISDWLQQQEHSFWLNFIFICGLVGTGLSCYGRYHNKIVKCLTVSTLLSIFWFRVCEQYYEHVILEARLCWMLIATTVVTAYTIGRKLLNALIIGWMLWCALLLRPYNVVLLPACYFSSYCLRRTCFNVQTKIVAHLWLSIVLYFCQGNCNSLASIDISPGYIGLSDYFPAITSFQILCHTYTFPILSYLLLFSSLTPEARLKMVRTLTVYRVLSITYFSIITLLHKNHLFIWSVFSPKLLIETSHTFVLLFVIIFYSVYSNCVHV